MAEATFGMLIEMCNKVGCDKGIKALERQILQLENYQANLYSGTPSQVSKATRLSQTIIKQNIAIGNLKQYKCDNIDKKPNLKGE